MMLWSRDKSRTKLDSHNHLNINADNLKRFGMAKTVVKELYRVDGGLRAYYRGYLSSVATYVPTSALWWMFYPVYSGTIVLFPPIIVVYLLVTGELVYLVPEYTPHTLIHCSAGSLSGMTVASKLALELVYFGKSKNNNNL